MNILYIEDDLAEIYLIQAVLKKNNLNLKISFARSLNEAIKYLQSNSYKYIVTDYNLPGIQAPEIARKLLIKFPLLKIISVSGAYIDGQIEEAKSAGIIDCLTKSTPPEKCLKDIIRLIS